MKVRKRVDHIKERNALVFPTSFGSTSPVCNIVLNFPEKMPPTFPRMLRTGGNSASIQDADPNSGMKIRAILPERSPPKSKDKAMRACDKIFRLNSPNKSGGLSIRECA